MSQDIYAKYADAIIADTKAKLIEVLKRSPEAAFKITVNVAPGDLRRRRKWNTEVSERTDNWFDPMPE